MTTPTIHSERHVLPHPDDPGRRVRVRVERAAEPPPGTATASGQRPCVVLVHGFKGFMDWGFFPYLSRRFAAAGFVAVSMNGSGSGVGDDPLEMDDDEAFFRDTYTRQLEDIARARAFARALPGVDPARELLFGHSRGGGMAILSAAEEPPKALVTWAAIDSADRWDEATKRQWRTDGVLLVPNARTGQVHRMSSAMLEDYEESKARLDVLGAASRLTVPALVLHGALDGTVEPDAARRIAAAAPGAQIEVVPGADHGFGAVHPLADPEARPTLLAAVDATLEFAARTMFA